jgi:hypothetical protein
MAKIMPEDRDLQTKYKDLLNDAHDVMNQRDELATMVVQALHGEDIDLDECSPEVMELVNKLSEKYK